MWQANIGELKNNVNDRSKLQPVIVFHQRFVVKML